MQKKKWNKIDAKITLIYSLGAETEEKKHSPTPLIQNISPLCVCL